MNKKTTSIFVAAAAFGLCALVSGCGGGGSSNPDLTVTTTTTTTGTDTLVQLSGTLGIVTQSTDADNDGVSAIGEITFNGAGSFGATDLTALSYDSDTGDTTLTTLDLAAGSYNVGSDLKTFTLSDSSIGLGNVAGQIANNRAFAAGISVDPDDDTGIVLMNVPAGGTNNASIGGTYNIAVSNVGADATEAFGTATFDDGAVTGGSITFLSNEVVGGTVPITGGNYTVNSSGIVSATLELEDEDVVTINGILGTDGTIIMIASDLEETSELATATPANITTASDAFIGTTFSLFGIQAPLPGTSVGQALDLAPVANGTGEVTSGTGTIFSDGTSSTQSISDITGPYNVNADGAFSATTLTATTSSGNATVTFPSFNLDADQTYAIGTISATDGGTPNVSFGVIIK